MITLDQLAAFIAHHSTTAAPASFRVVTTAIAYHKESEWLFFTAREMYDFDVYVRILPDGRINEVAFDTDDHLADPMADSVFTLDEYRAFLVGSPDVSPDPMDYYTWTVQTADGSLPVVEDVADRLFADVRLDRIVPRG